jgi:hypothetical protein
VSLDTPKAPKQRLGFFASARMTSPLAFHTLEPTGFVKKLFQSFFRNFSASSGLTVWSQNRLGKRVQPSVFASSTGTDDGFFFFSQFHRWAGSNHSGHGNLAFQEKYTMNIPEQQITLKKKVGKSKGKEINYTKTVGGFHIITNHRGIVLGSGPHRAVARHIARQFDPDIEWNELSKSEHVPLAYFEHLLPEWEAITSQFRTSQGVE